MASPVQPLDSATADLSALGPDCYCTFSGDAQALHVGSNAERILGIAASELNGRRFLDVIHVQDRVAVAKAIADCAANSLPTRCEFRRQATGAAPQHDSGSIWYELRCVPLSRSHALTTPQALGVIRDLGNEARLVAELEAMRAHVDGISIAKGRFLANMSHELRTPLNAILGFSEFLQSSVMKSLPPERHQEYIGLIHASARHLLQVVNDILDMSKMDAGKYEILREPFELAPVLGECCAMMQGQAALKGLSLTLSSVPELPEICADARAIKQVVINLLSNAVKFTSDGGRVDVVARRRGRSVEIRVSDTGIGISPDHLQNLGTPFYQADSKYDRKYEGTGLGLSLVYGLVDLHDGKVEIESQRNRGTTVTIRLPIDGQGSNPVPAVENLQVIRAASLPAERPQAKSAKGL